jgi:type II secretion system protein G
VLAACSDGTDRAKRLIETTLPERRGVEYRNVQSFPGDVVCGEFKSADPLRGSSRFRRFIVRGEVPDNRPSEDDWHIFCSKDPAAALQARLGIGSPTDSASHLPAIRSDLRTLEAALAQYAADNHAMPSTEQGLAALVSASDIPPAPRRFREGGYIDQLPRDPWGRPYLFERDSLGGVAQNYRIYTLGADGREGGQGEDADVGSNHLKYLDHIAP